MSTYTDSQTGNDQGLFGNETVTTTDTVGFTDEAVEQTIGRAQRISEVYKESNVTDSTTTVSQYLSRLRKVDSFNFSDRTFFVKDMMNNPQILDKLRGSMGVTGSFHFRITWNSDPMIQGLYIMAYVPYGVDFPSSHITANGMFLSGCPHVLINIARDTAADLIVPYVGETPYIPMVPATLLYEKQLGALVLASLDPVRSSASPITLNGSLFFALKDAQTLGNVGMHAEFQAAASLLALGNAAAEAVKKSKVVSTGSQSIADWLNKDSGSGFVPTLRKSAGWLFGGVSKIADLLGWSKPFSLVAVQPVANLPMADLVTSDATFTGLKFANNTDAGIGSVDLSDNGTDQLQIRNFIRKELIPVQGAIGGILIKKTDLPGHLCGRYDVNFLSWKSPSHRGDYDVVALNHFSFLAEIFEKWRGSHTLHLVPSCTKFHSCRLRVVFTPFYATNENALEIYENMSYTYSWVVDISDPSTWAIDIPFMNINPWSLTGETSGSVLFFLENPLVAPDNVHPEIRVFCFAEPGDDLEFAQPHAAKNFQPWQTTDEPGTVNWNRFRNINPMNVEPDYYPPAELQGTIGTSRDVDESVAFVKSHTQSTTANLLAMGDPVRSLATVLRRFWPAMRTEAPSNGYFVVPRPFNFSSDFKNPDMIALIAMNYGFFRGGMRFASQNNQTGEIFVYAGFSTDDGSMNCVGVDPTVTYMLGGQIIPFGVIDPVKFELPYYQTTIAMNNWKRFGGDGQWMNSLVHVRYADEQVAHTLVLRSVADDFQFGFLIGAPSKIVAV